MISVEYVLIFILLVIIFLIKNEELKLKYTEVQGNVNHNNIKSQYNENQIEHFIDGNFNICDERDCACLKLHTAPDGTCTEERVSNIPKVPNYEERIFFKNASAGLYLLKVANGNRQAVKKLIIN